MIWIHLIDRLTKENKFISDATWQKSKLARQEISNHMKILNLISAYRELHPKAKKFTNFQINPLIASRLVCFSVPENFYFQVKECDIVPSVK